VLPRTVEKKSVCGCSFVSSHDVDKSHVEVASSKAILADISMTISVAEYVTSECECRDMDAVDCSPAVLEEGVPPRVHENFLGGLVGWVFDVFFVERAREEE
jgi:myo-inositol-1-phosphate synthase